MIRDHNRRTCGHTLLPLPLEPQWLRHQQESHEPNQQGPTNEADQQEVVEEANQQEPVDKASQQEPVEASLTSQSRHRLAASPVVVAEEAREMNEATETMVAMKTMETQEAGVVHDRWQQNDHPSGVERWQKRSA